MTLKSKILKPLYNLLLPPACFGCNALLSGGEAYICSDCRHSLPHTEYNFVDENRMDIDFAHLAVVRKCAALFFFSDSGTVQSLLHFLKYRSQPIIGKLIGNMVLEQCRLQHLTSRIDAIVPVPLSPAKKRIRGYNQLDTFGQTLSESLGIPYLEHGLVRQDSAGTLSKMSRAARASGRGLWFNVAADVDLSGQRVLLIDDVTTTGLTLSACTRELERAGIREVFLLCMAVVGDR